MNVVAIILVVVGTVLVGMVALSGFRYATGRTPMESAKFAMANSLLGLIFVIFLLALVKAVENFKGIENRPDPHHY